MRPVLRRPGSTPPAASAAGTGRIAGLDGVRAICAWTVVGIHLGLLAHVPERFVTLIDPVTVFFVISGFIITRNLLVERELSGTVSLRRFWRNRSLRIFPVYFAFLAVLVVMRPTNWFAPVTDEHLRAAATYTSNFLPNRFYSGHLGATWSLAIEEHFYLVWPLVMWGLWRLKAWVACVGLVGCMVVRYHLADHPDVLAGYRPMSFTIPGADAILVGCLLAFWLHRHPVGPRSTWHRALLPVAVTLCAVALVHPSGPLASSAQHHAFLAGIAAIVLWIVVSQGSFAVRLLEWRPIRYFGTISYGIYIWQALWLSTGSSEQLHWIQHFPQVIPVIALTAACSWRLIEQPFLRLKAPPVRDVVSTGADRRVDAVLRTGDRRSPTQVPGGRPGADRPGS